MDLASKNKECLNKRINMSNLYDKFINIEIKSNLLSLMCKKSNEI